MPLQKEHFCGKQRYPSPTPLAGWVFFDQQVLQKVDELRTVLGFGYGSGDGIVGPIVAAKHMAFLFDPRTGRRNTLRSKDPSLRSG